jgi:hypothetical protein
LLVQEEAAEIGTLRVRLQGLVDASTGAITSNGGAVLLADRLEILLFMKSTDPL